MDDIIKFNLDNAQMVGFIDEWLRLREVGGVLEDDFILPLFANYVKIHESGACHILGVEVGARL